MKPFITNIFMAAVFSTTAQTDISLQNNSNMKVAVWDTYVKSKQGHVLHFDIIVPEAQKDAAMIYAYGKKHLSAIGEGEAVLATEQCQFCHIEAPSLDIVEDITAQGFYILTMDDIPAILPANPTRRDMVLHLRGHSDKYRFANLQGVMEEELRQMIAEGK